MKKAIKIPCLILLALVLLGGIAVYIAIDRVGDLLIRNVVESLDEETMLALEQGLEQLDTNVLAQTEEPPAEEGQAPQEPVETEENPAQQNAPEASPQQSTPDSTSNAGSSSKLDQIEYQDKVAAINLVKNKFSISEIVSYQDRVNREGVTSALLSEIKSILKARCSADEIQQLRTWYNKYK